MNINIYSLTDLKPGDRFRAMLADITPNAVTIKLANGRDLTAKSLILPDARIGEEAEFAVKENAKGQILLEMVKPDTASPHQIDVIKELLKNAAITPTTENIELTASLIKSGLPPDKEILTKAMFFNFIYKGNESGREIEPGKEMSVSEKLPRLLFLLKEGFAADKANVLVLEKILGKQLQLAAELTELAADMKRLGLITKSQEDKLFLELKPVLRRNNPRAINGYYKELAKTLAQLIKRLSDQDAHPAGRVSESGDQTGNKSHDKRTVDVSVKIMEKLVNASEELLFSSKVRVQREYFQIPYQINGEHNQSELYIFKDTENSKQTSDNSVRALVALDLAALGHVECLINKTEKTVNLEFKLKTDHIAGLMKRNSPKLIETLLAKGFHPSATFSKAEREFKLTDIPAGEKPVKARFAFDMRV